MAFSIDKIIFSPILDPISVTHTVGFGSSINKTYSIQNTDVNEVKINIQSPTGVKVEPSFIQLAPNQRQTVVITADRTFFDTLPKGANNFNIQFSFQGQGDPIDPTSDVLIYELQLTSTPSLTIKVAQTAAITAQVLEKNLTKQTQNVVMNKIITYQSSNPSVVSVGQLSGVATGVAPGNAQVTVTSQGVGQAIVLVGVYADPPAPRWWEKVVVNTTSAQRWFAGPFTTPIQPYPTRETRNGILYDVYYSEISEDRINTTTYYYDWVDVTNNVQQLTDTEKLAKGYIASSTKPAAPAPQTVDGNIVRVVTNAKFEERIVPIITSQVPSPTPSVTPSRPIIPPTPSPSTPKVIKYCLQEGQIASSVLNADGTSYVCRYTTDPTGASPDGCITKCGTEGTPTKPSQTPWPTPSPTPRISQTIPTQNCYAIPVWFDRADTFIDPPPMVGYEDCAGVAVDEVVSFNSSASTPQAICARRITSSFRVIIGNSTISPSCQPITPPPPSPVAPSPTPLPPQTIILSVAGGRGTVNGHPAVYTETIPFGSGLTVNCVPATGYEFDYAKTYNSQGIVTGGPYIYPNFLVYADGNLEEVWVYFRLVPTGGTSGGGGTKPPLY